MRRGPDTGVARRRVGRCGTAEYPANKELPLRELVKLPGRLLSEAKTAKQSGDLLTGYRVEEVWCASRH